MSGAFEGGHRPRSANQPPKPHGRPPNQGSGGTREAVKTLRDEFAMAMLQPIATTAVAMAVTVNPTEVASLAYQFADAMLAAREVKP